jgi:hypothetical protein
VKRALICSVTALTLVLVGSCGSSHSEPAQANSEGSSVVVDRFDPGFGEIIVLCRKQVLYVVSKTYGGSNVQRMTGQRECEGK